MLEAKNLFFSCKKRKVIESSFPLQAFYNNSPFSFSFQEKEKAEPKRKRIFFWEPTFK